MLGLLILEVVVGFVFCAAAFEYSEQVELSNNDIVSSAVVNETEVFLNDGSVQFTFHLNGHVEETVFSPQVKQLMKHGDVSNTKLSFSTGRVPSGLHDYYPGGALGTPGGLLSIVPVEGADIDTVWRKITRSYGGLFCTSFDASTYEEYGHGDEVVRPGVYTHMFGEVLCSENLFSFLRMLPCGQKSGLSSIIDLNHFVESSVRMINLELSFMDKIIDMLMKVKYRDNSLQISNWEECPLTNSSSMIRTNESEYSGSVLSWLSLNRYLQESVDLTRIRSNVQYVIVNNHDIQRMEIKMTDKYPNHMRILYSTIQTTSTREDTESHPHVRFQYRNESQHLYFQYSLLPHEIVTIKFTVYKEFIQWPSYTYAVSQGLFWKGPVVFAKFLGGDDQKSPEFHVYPGNHFLFGLCHMGGFFNTLSFVCVTLLMSYSATANLIFDSKPKYHHTNKSKTQ